MPLTPQDVSNKRFTPVRLREGYDMGEVDQFLDEVEAELERLTRETEDLRSQLAAGGGRSSAPSGGDGGSGTPLETIQVTTAPEASSAATRLLELATRNADELVDGARADAEQLLGDARIEAERLTVEAAEEAAQVEEDARNRSRRLDEETAERRTQLMNDLEDERDQLGAEVEDLKAFEREYRSRLRGYFQAQLERLDAEEEGAADQAAALLDDEG